jgi:hypothetical protein
MSAPAQEYDDRPSKDGPLNYAPKKARHREPDRVDADQVGADGAGAPTKAGSAGQRASPKREASDIPEPPWRRSTQRGVFAGDIAAVELRNRLALAPDRLPEPPRALSTGPRYGRLAAVLVVAAVGFVGYRLGSAPPSAPRQLTPQQSSQQQLTSYTNLTLDSNSLAEQPGVGRGSAGRVLDTARGLSTGPAAVNRAPVAPQSAEAGVRSAATAKEIALPSNQHLADDSVTDRNDLQPQWLGNNVNAPAQPPSRQHDAEEIAVMIKAGAELVASKDFAAARLMYQRAAEAGSAMAAFALAETYDPLVLGKLNAREGIMPDFTLAATWYEKAKNLGSSEAPERLERLVRLHE